jgi:hypothetical protein
VVQVNADNPCVNKALLDRALFLGYTLLIEYGAFSMTKITITEINVDLDGVMVNFLARAIEVSGINPEASLGDPAHKLLKRTFWKEIEKHVKAGNKFFETMDPMHDAFVLWDHLKTIDAPKVICTATGHIIGAKEEKRAWIRHHLGHDHANSARIVRDGKDKAKYATPTTILIDDRMKVITPWVDAGGIGVYHTSAASTIEKLKELGL